MNNISSPALVFPNPEYRNLDQQKEEARQAFKQIKNGQERLENALTALGILGEASVQNESEIIQSGIALTRDESDEITKANIAKAKILYKRRLKIKVPLRKIVRSYSNLSGDLPSDEKFSQLKELKEEQVAAINDDTLKNMLLSPGKTMKNFDWFKTLSPEEIIIIQEIPSGKTILFNILEGNYSDEEKLSSLKKLLYRGIKEYSE